jgi:hypothetical protein
MRYDAAMNFGGEESIGFATARGRDWPSVRQFSVLLENRVGVMMELVRAFEASQNRIVALSVHDSADCAIFRMVLRDPERARETFEQNHWPFVETDLLVVQLPDGPQPLAKICKALLATEINIHYAYPLMLNPHGQPAMALHVDSHETAVSTLQSQGFTIFTEGDLEA